MIALLSPSKTMDTNPVKIAVPCSYPCFNQEVALIIKEMKKKSPEAIAQMMGVSEKLAQETYHRYQQFAIDKTAPGKPALLSYSGDVYLGLQAQEFTNKELLEANQKLRILSGLYGYLKPLDLIQAYRLEIGGSFRIGTSPNLYQFWGDKIAKAIMSDADYLTDNTIINLASDEYFNSVKKYLPADHIMHVQFKEWKNGKWAFLSFHAKKARGMMGRYLVKNKVKNISGLNKFDLDGYSYNAKLSSEKEMVFTRGD